MDSKDIKRVTGLGGFFFKCDNPNDIKEWYKNHLGIPTDQYGWTFWWKDADGNDHPVSAMFAGERFHLSRGLGMRH